jgi:FMN phosphatase YigB (HAD superfamily)
LVQTVIFDIGGTLLGAPDLFSQLSVLFPEQSAYDRLKSALMEEYGSIANGRKPFATMKEIIGNALRTVSAELGCADVSDRAGEVYYSTFVTQSWLYDDTISILEYLQSRGISMIVASDGDSELLYDEFRMHGLGKYFHRIFISSEVGAYKPSDKFVSALMPETGGSPGSVLFVGDSECDIVTGRKLGVHTVLKGDATVCVSPDYRIERLAELEKIIDIY